MRIVKINKQVCLLEADAKDEGRNSFVFSVKMIPDTPIPKAVVIYRKWGNRIKTWRMSWKKFLEQSCIDDVAIISKDKFRFGWKASPKSL